MDISIGIKREVDLLNELELTFEQWGIIKLFWNAKHMEAVDGMSLIYKYFTYDDNVIIPKKEFRKLIDKGIILEFDDEEKFELEDVEFDEEFIDKVFIDIHAMGWELWDAFPRERSYRINGKALLIKKLPNQFMEKEDFFEYYCRIIKHNREKHSIVIKALQTCIEDKQVDFTIYEYIQGQMWEDMEIKDATKAEDLWD